MRLRKDFFERNTFEVASSLVGKVIIKYTDFFGQYIKLSGLITETEAYGYDEDPASHAFNGITRRNRAMFGNAGTAYVYFIYGTHYCFNIVAKKRRHIAGAVLIRSLEPLEGLGVMKILRRSADMYKLTSGPGKLTQAFNISIKHNHFNLTENDHNNYFYLEESKVRRDFLIVESQRIGVSKGLDLNWRYTMYVRENSDSGYRPSKYLSKLIFNY